MRMLLESAAREIRMTYECINTYYLNKQIFIPVGSIWESRFGDEEKPASANMIRLDHIIYGLIEIEQDILDRFFEPVAETE